jgi:rRNA small subunit methyltransferase G
VPNGFRICLQTKQLCQAQAGRALWLEQVRCRGRSSITVSPQSRRRPAHLTAWRQPQVLMLDALRKRCGFVEAAAGRMGLANVAAVWARAEDAGQDPRYREVRVLQLPPNGPGPSDGHNCRCCRGAPAGVLRVGRGLAAVGAASGTCG